MPDQLARYQPFESLVRRVAHLPDDMPERQVDRIIRAGLAGVELGPTMSQRVGVTVTSAVLAATLAGPIGSGSEKGGGSAGTTIALTVDRPETRPDAAPTFSLASMGTPAAGVDFAAPPLLPLPPQVEAPKTLKPIKSAAGPAGFDTSRFTVGADTKLPDRPEVNLGPLQLTTSTPNTVDFMSGSGPALSPSRVFPRDTGTGSASVRNFAPQVPQPAVEAQATDITQVTGPLINAPGAVFARDTVVPSGLEIGVYDKAAEAAKKRGQKPPKQPAAPAPAPAPAPPQAPAPQPQSPQPTTRHEPNYSVLPSMNDTDARRIQHTARFLDQHPEIDLSPKGALWLTANGAQESRLNTHAVGDHGTARRVFQQRFDRLRRMDKCISERPNTGGEFEELEKDLWCAINVDMKTDTTSVRAKVLETLRKENPSDLELMNAMNKFERYSMKDRNRDGKPDGEGSRFSDAVAMVRIVEAAPPLVVSELLPPVVPQASVGPSAAPEAVLVPPAPAVPAVVPQPGSIAGLFPTDALKETAPPPAPEPKNKGNNGNEDKNKKEDQPGSNQNTPNEEPKKPDTSVDILDAIEGLVPVNPGEVFKPDNVAPEQSDIQGPDTIIDTAPTEEQLAGAEPPAAAPPPTTVPPPVADNNPAPRPQNPDRDYKRKGKYYQMPESRDGTWRFEGFTPEENRYGDKGLVDLLIRSYEKFRSEHPGMHINQGDLNAPGHASHKTGEDADMDGFGMDGGKETWIFDMTKRGYNPNLTIIFGRILLETCEVQRAFFNDPNVRRDLNAYAFERCGTKPFQHWPNHANHLHLRRIAE